jgi:hypothetical protein
MRMLMMMINGGRVGSRRVGTGRRRRGGTRGRGRGGTRVRRTCGMVKPGGGEVAVDEQQEQTEDQKKIAVVVKRVRSVVGQVGGVQLLLLIGGAVV